MSRQIDERFVGAARAGDLELLERLEQEGANLEAVSVVDIYKMTPLLWAVYFGHAPCVATLLGFGADLEARSSLGQTALMVAAESERILCLKMLIVAGSSVHAASAASGWTAMSWAANSGRANSVRSLIEAGANFDGVVGAGMTPLMLSAHCGGANCVRVLLAAGANALAVDGTGDSAAGYADRAGHADIAHAIRSSISQTERVDLAASFGQGPKPTRQRSRRI